LTPGGSLGKQEPKPREAPQQRVAAGKSLSPDNALLAWAGPGPSEGWKGVASLGTLYTRDLLLALPGDRAALKSNDGSLQLSLRGNLPQLTPYPALESAIVLHPPTEGVSLDFTLDRGRVVVSNTRDKGAARCRFRVQRLVNEITLNEPGAAVVLELYGRMLQGLAFNKDPQNPALPASELSCLVLKGTMELKDGSRVMAMSAPPGPAAFHWSSTGNTDTSPRQLEKLPSWLDGGAPSAAGKVVEGILERVHELMRKQPPDVALVDLLGQAARETTPSQASITRSIAVFGLGALGNVARLVDVLSDGKPEEVRELAIEALRHYIGRGPGQDQRIYLVLTDQRKYTPAQATIFVQLLHSFGELDLSQPETYATLIAYVKHARPAIRELAKWHLTRLVPGGNQIKYDPAGPIAEQEKAYQEWKRLVPDDKVPQGPGSPEKK
jgi:hypothetical protein